MQPSLKPLELTDHLLWPDGTIQVTPDKVIDFTYKLAACGKVDHLSVTEVTPEIKQYNVLSEHPLSVKNSVDQRIFPPDWVLPEKYSNLDLETYLMNLADKIEQDHLYEVRLERFAEELYRFKSPELEQVLRVLIYVIETLRSQDIVWGVGRGSSCSSYLLYLLGLHEVDAVLYDVDLTDFLKP